VILHYLQEILATKIGGHIIQPGGKEVESNIIVEGENYIFSKDIGNISHLPIIVIHLEKVMDGQFIFINGIFQISENYIFFTDSQTPTPTPIVTPINLKIDIPEKPIQLRMVPIRITYCGIPIIGGRVDYDGNMIGETDNNGSIDFVLDTSGIHTIAASKKGYYNGSEIVTVVTPAPSPKMNQTPESTADFLKICIRFQGILRG
jgi:hypothetical protein